VAYDSELDRRVSAVIADWGTTRKKMFGGTCYVLHGNMLCGVLEDSLILRLGREKAAPALAEPHTNPFDVSGRPMKGWVMVEKAGLTDEALADWLLQARSFTEKLPPK